MNTETVARTDEEIVVRIQAIEMAGSDDLFGAQVADLTMALSWKAARDRLTDAGREAGESAWETESRQKNPASEAREYMGFALDKVEDHRGLSANRSIDHMRAWVWLMGDEAYESINWEEYANYGAPILKAICELVDYPWPAENEALSRMARGLPCDPEGCVAGCAD